LIFVHQKILLIMETKNKNEVIIKDFKAVKFMREVRDKISIDIQDMNFDQIKLYFEKRKAKLIEK
jgi:hypothetical protein